VRTPDDRAGDSIGGFGSTAPASGSESLERGLDPRPSFDTWASIVACVPLAILAWFRLEGTSRAWDAFAQRAVVDRVARLGGTYYTTGSDQKGPLWLGVYSIVDHLTSERTFWFGVGIGITALAAVTCAASVRIVDRTIGRHSATRWLAVAMFTYLVFGPEEFTGVLYSRNIVTCLFALAFALVLTADAQAGRRRWALLVGAGIAAGFAVQTMPSSGLVCVVLVALVWTRSTPVGARAAPMVTFASAAALSFASAFVWYAARGALSQFWQDWWTYNKIYSQATGRSPVNQLLRGLSEFGSYYARHPVVAVGIAAAIADLLVRRREVRRDLALQIQLAVVLWWLSECLSVTVAQRFFDHYFLLPFTPSAILTLLMLVKALRTRPHLELIGAGALVALALAGCDPGLRGGIQTIRSFHGFGALASQRVDELPKERQALRAAVAALSSPDDFVFVWSRYPGLYTDISRTAATRYIENRWATGEIYGGSRSDANVLPGTIDRIMDDLRATKPMLVVVPDDEHLPPTGPITDYVDQNFVLAFDGDAYNVYARPERLADWLAPRTGGRWLSPEAPSGRSGWSAVGTTIRWTTLDPRHDLSSDLLFLPGLDPCFELTLESTLGASTSAPSLTFSRGVRDYDGITLGPVVSGVNRVGGKSLILSATSVGIDAPAVRLIVGSDSAVAVVDGRVVAVSERRSAEVALRPRAGSFSLKVRSYAARPDLCSASH